MPTTPRTLEQHVAALVYTEAGALLLLADLSSARSKPAGRLVLAEELTAEEALARVRQLADDAAGSSLALTVWQSLEGAEAVTLTVPLDPGLRAADEAKIVQAALARTPWTDEVIRDEDLSIEYLSRGNRIHFVAVRGDQLEARERALEDVPLRFAPLSHALVALVERCQPEATMPKGPMSLALLCLPRSLAAVVVARGELLLVTQFDLTELIRDEATALKEGQIPPYGFRNRMAHAALEIETLVYQRVLESALDHVRRMLAEKGENPEAIRRVYYTGEAVARYDVAEHLVEAYGAHVEVREILATRVCQMFAAGEAEREQARHIVANEARYATGFAMLATAMSDKPVAFRTAVPYGSPSSAAGAARYLTISSPNLLVALGACLVVFVGVFMSYFWYLGYRIDASRAAYAREETQRQIYAEYGAKRAEKEARAAHILDLVRLVETEQHTQALPVRVTDDVDRSLRSTRGVNAPGDERSRLEWSMLAFGGRTVTIRGTARYRDNAVAFAEALGNLDERRTFTGVDTKWKERALAPSEETPAGDVTFDFTITAEYTPRPAAE